MFAAGIMDHKHTGSIDANVTSDRHNELARELSRAGSQLLVNKDETLPIPNKPNLNIAVLGDAAHDHPIIAGGGSGAVTPPYIITVLDGISNRAAKEQGQTVSYGNTADLQKAKQLASSS